MTGVQTCAFRSSFLHRRIQILSSPADPFFAGYPDPFFLKTTNLDHFFTGSFLHRPIQILSSSADPRTKLRRRRSFLHRPIHEPSSGDADPFFIGRSTNQARRPRSFLHRPIHEPFSGDPYPFFTGDPYLSVGLSVWVCLCVGVFLC